MLQAEQQIVEVEEEATAGIIELPAAVLDLVGGGSRENAPGGGY